MSTPTKRAGLKTRVWRILAMAEPDDLVTRIVNYFILALILLNVLAVVFGTVRAVEQRFQAALFWFEVFSVAVFAVEYMARVWSCVADDRYAKPIAGRLRFMATPMALIDLIAILPFFLTFVSFDLRFVRALRLFRLARLAKLGRYSTALRLFGRVFINRKEDLIISIVLMGLLVLLSSSFMYFAEHEAQPDRFSDIPSSMWWAVVTLTTVGYGDVYPVTPLGKVFAGFVAIFGVGMVALPTAIVSASFLDEMRREKQPNRVCPHCGKQWDPA